MNQVKMPEVSQMNEWIRRLVTKYPTMFDTRGSEGQLYITGGSQYIYSTWASDANKFWNYDIIANPEINTRYHANADSLEIMFWNTDYSRDMFSEKIASYEQLEEKSLKLYEFMQTWRKYWIKKNRMSLIDEL